MSIIPFPPYRRAVSSPSNNNRSEVLSNWARKLVLATGACVLVEDALRVNLNRAHRILQIAEQRPADAAANLHVIEAELTRDLAVLQRLYEQLQSALASQTAST